MNFSLNKTILAAAVVMQLFSSVAFSQEIYKFWDSQSSVPISSVQINPFVTDGCTMAPDRSLINSEKDWTVCCVEHDIAHWAGGGAEQRLASDVRLKSCMNKVGGPGGWFYFFVQAFGRPSLDIEGGLRKGRTSPWGYGWDHLSGHSFLSSIQKKSVCKEFGKWRLTQEFEEFLGSYVKAQGVEPRMPQCEFE